MFINKFKIDNTFETKKSTVNKNNLFFNKNCSKFINLMNEFILLNQNSN